jgi:predicted negative regulator of RcsB-dependent stress response
LERAAQLTPNNATIQEHLGDVYFALGERERARQAYELAVSLEDRENLERVKSKLMALGTDDDR